MEMKIFFTFDNTTAVGGGSAIYNSIIASKAEDIVLICPPGSLASKCKEYAKVYTFHKRSNLLVSAIKLRKVLKEVPKKTEVNVHGISTMPLVFLSTFGLKLTRTYTEHLLTDRYVLPGRLNNFVQKLAYFFLIRTYKHVYCVSQSVQDYLHKRFFLSNRKTSITYNTVPKVLHKPIRHRERKTLHLVTVGSLTKVKNLKSLLKAVSLLEFNYELLIIGEGAARIELQEYSKELLVNKKVKFLGNIKHREVLDRLTESDIYIQTSLTESFGYAIAEAMSVGLPVIAFNVGGIPELVQNNETGILVESYEIEGISAAIELLGADVKLRAKLGRNGFKSLKKFPRVDAYID